MISGRELERRYRRGAARGINDSIEHLLGEAVQEAPVETGRLRAAGHVTRKATPGDLEAELAFDTPYAAAQHEGTATMVRGGNTVTLVFRNHPRGGKKKYIADPLKANVHRYGKVIAARARQALEE
jgi:hypothetical protein